MERMVKATRYVSHCPSILEESTTLTTAQIEHPLRPAEKVFNIVELAEHIFLDLPPRDILVNIQRTCKQFKAVVEGSGPLQQALFFEPISPIRLQLARCNKRSRCSSKWMLSTLGDAYCFTEGDSYCVWIHPLFGRIKENDPRYEARCTYVNASWRRQLVSQPAIYSCALVDDDDIWVSEDEVVTTANPKGMLVSEIAKLCTGLKRKRHVYMDGLAYRYLDQSWAWHHLPAGELLEELHASLEHHDGEAINRWCESEGHFKHAFSIAARNEREARLAKLRAGYASRV
jgi:hypothetical protein